MRGIIILVMLAASLAHAGWADYREQRDLELDAGGIDSVRMDVGAGSLTVTGAPDADAITVNAIIQVDENNDDTARKLIAEHLVLTLERRGDTAELRSLVENDGWWGGGDIAVALEVKMPAGIELHIDDTSGSLKVKDIGADVTIDDSSGSIKVYGVANLKIDDSSGSIDVAEATGDVSIVDGSGSITVRGVAGSVTIDDGSGSIDVSDVEHDVIIEEDGSGGLSVSDVRGNVDSDG